MFLRAIAGVLSLGGISLPSSAGDVERLAWMEGRWVGEQDGATVEERWTGPIGGALLGIHADVKKGRLAFWEFLRIDTTEEGTFYFASPRSAAPTPFKLVSLEEKRAVFENRQHDFPQRILYWLDEQGRLHARIEGPRGGKTVSSEWVWTKKP
jgi:hypothetical protein